MKNSIKTLLCAFPFVTTIALSAKADDKETKKTTMFGTGIYADKAGNIKVMVEKVNSETNTTLLVTKKSGYVIYRETINRNNMKFGRLLKLDELENGNYTIKIISNGETQIKSFKLADRPMERSLKID